MAFSVSRILLTFATVVVLLAGAIQGAVSYIDYCDEHSDADDYVDTIINYKEKVCDFSSTGKYNGDVDFVSVVALSGVGALLWVSREVVAIAFCLQPKFDVAIFCICTCMHAFLIH